MFPRNKSVKVPVVKLKSGLVKKDITFPATTKSLWNPEKQGSMIPIHFANYRNPQIQLTERAVILANRHASQSKEKIYRCFLIGHCLMNTDDEGITLIIDRFDPGSSTPGRNDFIPTTLLPGDFAVPLTISQSSPDYFPTHSSQDIIHSAKLIEHLVCSKEKLALGRLLPLRAHCTCYDHHDHVTVALTISSVTVSNGYELNTVTPVPILQTALARNLSGPLSLSEIQKTHKMGYLSMDQTRKLLLMIETDPKISTLPIVGLWLSGVLSAYSPHTWAACLRFMHNNSIQQRILSETGCFLLVLYSPTASQPLFYQCRPLEEDVSFQLYECKENLHCMKNFKKSPVLLELSPAKDGPQQATFLDAMQKFKPQRSSNVTPLSKSAMNRPVAEIEEPKPLPSPKPLLHQNASLKPAVPELSVLFDSFDESLSKNSPIQLQQASSSGRQPNKHISPHNTPHIQPYHPMYNTPITSGNHQYRHTPSSLGYRNSSSGHPQEYSLPPPTSSGSGISVVNQHPASGKRYTRPQPVFAHQQHSSSAPQMTSPGSVGYPHNSSGYQRNYSGNPPVSLGNPLQVISEPRLPYQYTPMTGKQPASTPHMTGSVAGNGMPITDTPHYPVMEMKSKMMLGRTSSINHPVHQCHTAPVMNTGSGNITSQIPGYLHTNRPDKRRMSEHSYNTPSVKEHRRLSAPSNIDCPCPHQQCLHSPQPTTPNAPPNGVNYSNMPHNIRYQSADGRSSSIQAGVSQNIQTARHDPDIGRGESIDYSSLPFGSNYQNSNNRAHEQIETSVQQQIHQNRQQLLPTPSTTVNQLHNCSYQGLSTELCSSESQQLLQQQYPLPQPSPTGHHFKNNSDSSQRVHTELSENSQRHQQIPIPMKNNVGDCSASSHYQYNSPEISKMVSNQSYSSNPEDKNKAAIQPGPDEHTLQQLKRQDELIKNLQAQVQSLLLAQAASQVVTPLTPPETPMHQPQGQAKQTPAKSAELVKKTMCNISVNTGTSLCWPDSAGVSPVKDGGLAVPEGQSRKQSMSTETTPIDNQSLNGHSSKLKISDRNKMETSNKENNYSTLNNSGKEHKESVVESIKNGDDLSARDSSATNLDDTLPDPQIQNDTRSLASSVLAVDLQSFNGSDVEQVATPERRGDVLTNSIISPVLGESASMLVRKPGAFVEGSVLHQADSLLYKDEAKFYDNLLGKVKKMLQGSESAERAKENKDDEQQQHHVKDDANSTDDETDEDTDSEVEDCEDIDEIIPSSGQSMYLSTVFPKTIDVSMVDLSMDSSNLSMEANAIAMKYLDDQQLSAMSEAFKAIKDPLARTAMLNNLTDKSSVDISTGGATNFSFASMKYLEKYGLLDTSMNLNKKKRKVKGKKIKKKPKEKKVEKRKREETTEDEYSIVTQDSMVEPFKFSPDNKEQMPSTPKPILVFGNRKQDLKNSNAKNISWNIGNTSSPRAPLQTITNKAETGTTQGMKVDNGVKNVLDVNRLKQLPKLL